MKVEYPYPNVVHLIFENQYEETSSFVRIQEFYESPYKEIRGKYFTLDTFMDVYSRNRPKKEFTYFTDWSGFNIPGHVILQFMEKFEGKYRPKEEQIIKKLPKKNLIRGEKFYLIGTHEGQKEDIIHELAHALFYLNREYRNEVLKIVGFLREKEFNSWEKWLTKKGYCKEVWSDEIQAYKVEAKDKRLRKIFDRHINAV